MAGQAFKDQTTVAALNNFVPILIDGDVEKKTTASFGVRGYPNTKFVTKKGKVLENVGGYVPTDRFLKAVNSALKKNGKVKLSKKYKALVASLSKAKKSMEKKRYGDAMKEIKKIVAVGHKGPELKTAEKMKAKIITIADERFAAAEALEPQEPKKAKMQFLKITNDFRGLEVAKRAKKRAKIIANRLKKEAA